MRIMQNAVGALFDEDDKVAEAVRELVATGVAPGSLRVATRAQHRARDLADRLHVRAVEDSSLAFELCKIGIDVDRAGHFASALGEGVLLILDGHDVSPERLSVLIRAHADLGMANVAGWARVIPLRAEILDVSKTVVVTNEVTVSTEIIRETKRYDIELVREEFVIRRTPAGEGLQPEVIRIPLQHEEVVMTKRTIVTEEVTVSTEQTLDVEHIEATVQHEVLRVVEETGPN